MCINLPGPFRGKRWLQVALVAALIAPCLPAVHGQTDWPVYGHDAGGMRYSPLKQINANNVARVRLAWTYDTQAAVQQAPAPGPAGGADRPGATRRPPRMRRSSTTPLVIGGVMYLSTAYNRVVALDPEGGEKFWEYNSTHTPAMRGIAYWPGDKQLPPQIVFGTTDGWLISLNAKTGKPSPGFGSEGALNLRIGVADAFPDRAYGLSSPPAIYRDVVITGSHV